MVISSSDKAALGLLSGCRCTKTEALPVLPAPGLPQSKSQEQHGQWKPPSCAKAMCLRFSDLSHILMDDFQLGIRVASCPGLPEMEGFLGWGTFSTQTR